MQRLHGVHIDAVRIIGVQSRVRIVVDGNEPYPIERTEIEGVCTGVGNRTNARPSAAGFTGVDSRFFTRISAAGRFVDANIRARAVQNVIGESKDDLSVKAQCNKARTGVRTKGIIGIASCGKHVAAVFSVTLCKAYDSIRPWITGDAR